MLCPSLPLRDWRTVESIDGADTAWVLLCPALVLLMTPGLALFYGGMVRAKSALNMIMMSFSALGVVTIVWVLSGAIADRVKFSARLVFAAVWAAIVYVPIAHWTFASDGWMVAHLGSLDFAGQPCSQFPINSKSV
jgi:ammonia channel protein AmtB